MRRKRDQRRNEMILVRGEGTDILQAADRCVWIFVARLCPHTTKEDVKNVFKQKEQREI